MPARRARCPHCERRAKPWPAHQPGVRRRPSVSARQGLEGWRAAIKPAPMQQRGFGELSALWARLPLVAVAPAVASGATSGGALPVAGPAMDSGTTGALAAILVRHADTLCPGGEAGWFQSSPLAQTIYQTPCRFKLAGGLWPPGVVPGPAENGRPPEQQPVSGLSGTHASQSQYGGAGDTWPARCVWCL